MVIRSDQKQGFTLVELLVVIAIIAILAAVLFPVFAQARESAKKSACLSNNKQLDLGVLLYANDYDDALMPVADSTNTVLWVDLEEPYIRNAQVRVCPDDPKDKVSYGLNSMVFADLFGAPQGQQTPTFTMGQFAFPSETIMISELGTQDNLLTPIPNSIKVVVPDDQLNDAFDGRPVFRHFFRDNLGFFDGHSKSMLKEQFYVGWSPADYWWCPDRSSQATCKTT
jgi:prepilin-type N-terminal cleavage/methylation domain-containing protein